MFTLPYLTIHLLVQTSDVGIPDRGWQCTVPWSR